MKYILTVAVAALAFTYAIPTETAIAQKGKKYKKTCFEICQTKGGISNRQLHKCATRCEKNRASK